MHIHISLLTAMNVFLMWLVIRFFWLTIAEKFADYPFAQAMAKLA